MATIQSFGPLRSVRGEAHTFLIASTGGKVFKSGTGLSFWLWFWQKGVSLSEVPVTDQTVPLTFRCRTKDFQDVTVSATAQWRVSSGSAEAISSRFNFAVDTDDGKALGDPATDIATVLTNTAQQAAWSYIAEQDLEPLLGDDPKAISDTVLEALQGLDIGIEVFAASVTSIAPNRDVAQALQTKTTERLKKEADEATFERRANATEKERAIAEADLNNKLELAKQREGLIAQERKNKEASAESEAAVSLIRTEAELDQGRKRTEAKLEDQKLTAERKREDDRLAEEQRLAAKDASDKQALETRVATDAQAVAHERELVTLRVDETRRALRAFEGKGEEALARALQNLPEALSNLSSVTVGGGALEALQKLAENSERF